MLQATHSDALNSSFIFKMSRCSKILCLNLASSASSLSDSVYQNNYFCLGRNGLTDRAGFAVLIAKALKGGLIGEAVSSLNVEQISKGKDEGQAADQRIEYTYHPYYLNSGVVVPVHVRNILMATQILILSKMIVKIMKASMLRRNK